jgi:hypothetical protein
LLTRRKKDVDARHTPDMTRKQAESQNKAIRGKRNEFNEGTSTPAPVVHALTPEAPIGKTKPWEKAQIGPNEANGETTMNSAKGEAAVAHPTQ